MESHYDPEMFGLPPGPQQNNEPYLPGFTPPDDGPPDCFVEGDYDPAGLDQHEPGAKLDGGKPMFDLVPPVVEDAIAIVMTYGARKYTRDGWKKVANGWDRYYAALRRHLSQMRDGFVLDPESGLPHSWHALCCMAFLVYLENEGEHGRE